MRICSAATLAEIGDVWANHGVLFIADEVMTGLGRTGTLLACEQTNIQPIFFVFRGADRRVDFDCGDACERGHVLPFKRALNARELGTITVLEIALPEWLSGRGRSRTSCPFHTSRDLLITAGSAIRAM